MRELMKLELNTDGQDQNFPVAWIVQTSNQHADKLLVEMIHEEMRNKLREKREQGYVGWHTPQCSNDKLLSMLKDNLEKGKMINVINLAAMIHVRQKLFNEVYLGES